MRYRHDSLPGDRAAIAADLAAGGPAAQRITTVSARSVAASARIAAAAYCHGTPLRHEIEARGPGGPGEATDISAQAITRRYGNGVVDGKIQAHVVEADRE